MFYRFHSFSYWILINLRIRLKRLRQIHWAYNFIRINFSIQFKRRHNKIIATMMAHLKWHHFWSFPLKFVHMTKKTGTQREKKNGTKKTSRHFGHDFYVFMSYFSLFASRNLAKIYFFIQVFFFFCFYFLIHVFFFFCLIPLYFILQFQN